MSEQLGWLDTNIFIHNLYRNDPQHRRCVAIFKNLEAGEAEAWIDILVVHELTYVLIRHPGFRTRDRVYIYIADILKIEAIRAHDKGMIIETLTRWSTTRIGFVDTWLGLLAERDSLPVCSVNARDFPGIDNSF